MIQTPKFRGDYEQYLLADRRTNGAASTVRSKRPWRASRGWQVRSDWNNIHQSQWLVVIRGAEGIRAGKDPLRPLETMG